MLWAVKYIWLPYLSTSAALLDSDLQLISVFIGGSTWAEVQGRLNHGMEANKGLPRDFQLNMSFSWFSCWKIETAWLCRDRDNSGREILAPVWCQAKFFHCLTRWPLHFFLRSRWSFKKHHTLPTRSEKMCRSIWSECKLLPKKDYSKLPGTHSTRCHSKHSPKVQCCNPAEILNWKPCYTHNFKNISHKLIV